MRGYAIPLNSSFTASMNTGVVAKSCACFVRQASCFPVAKREACIEGTCSGKTPRRRPCMRWSKILPMQETRVYGRRPGDPARQMVSHRALCQNGLPFCAISFATRLESIAERPAKPDERQSTHQLLQLRLKGTKYDKPASR